MTCLFFVFQPMSYRKHQHKHGLFSLNLTLSLGLWHQNGLIWIFHPLISLGSGVWVTGTGRRKSRCVVKCFLGEFRFAGETLLRVVKSEENAPIPLINYHPGALTLPQSMPLFTHPPAAAPSSLSISLYFPHSYLARSNSWHNTHLSGEQSSTCTVFDANMLTIIHSHAISRPWPAMWNK